MAFARRHYGSRLPRREKHTETRRHFATHFENCLIVRFPEAHRPFNEVIVFGHKRTNPQPDGQFMLAREGFSKFRKKRFKAGCRPARSPGWSNSGNAIG